MHFNSSLSNLKSIDNIRNSFLNMDTFNHDQMASTNHHTNGIQQHKSTNSNHISQPTPRYAFLEQPASATTTNQGSNFNFMFQQQQQQQEASSSSPPNDYFNIQSQKELNSKSLLPVIKDEMTENNSHLFAKTNSKTTELIRAGAIGC